MAASAGCARRSPCQPEFLPAPPSLGATCDLDATGAVFGGQIGYNWQQREWVFGLEADGSWTGLKEDVSFAPAFPHIKNDKIDWLASVRGRAGLGDGRHAVLCDRRCGFRQFQCRMVPRLADRPVFKSTPPRPAGLPAAASKDVQPHWSARAEFLHYGFGTKSLTSTTGGTYTTAFRHDVSVVRLGINFRP